MADVSKTSLGTGAAEKAKQMIIDRKKMNEDKLNEIRAAVGLPPAGTVEEVNKEKKYGSQYGTGGKAK